MVNPSHVAPVNPTQTKIDTFFPGQVIARWKKMLHMIAHSSTYASVDARIIALQSTTVDNFPLHSSSCITHVPERQSPSLPKTRSLGIATGEQQSSEVLRRIVRPGES